MSKYIKIEDLRLHLQNLVLDGERLDPKTTRLIIMTLRELPIHEFDDESATTTDCISRQQAVEAVTNTIREKFSLADWYEQLVETGLEIENLIKELPPVTPTDKVVDFNNMISAGGRIRNLPPVAPTVSEDCISRAEALDEFKKDYDDVFDLMTAIEELPSVTPTERTGKWIEPVQPHQVDCTGCKFVGTYDTDFPCANCVRKTKDYYCGAKMGGDTE